MTILKTGKIKTYIFECSECDCVFTANSEEVMEYRSVLGIDYPVMKCPWCKVKIVSGNEITDEDLENLIKKLEEDDDGSSETTS